jgi:hypothetical protein
MFSIFSRPSGKRNFYAARVEEVSMRSFASAIDKSMLFQIGDELPNLARHTNNIIESENFKASPLARTDEKRVGAGLALSDGRMGASLAE